MLSHGTSDSETVSIAGVTLTELTSQEFYRIECRSPGISV